MSDADQACNRALGQRVRAARDAAGLAQSAVERRAGLVGATIARLERGEGPGLTVPELIRVATALGVEPASLVPPAAS